MSMISQLLTAIFSGLVVGVALVAALTLGVGAR